MPENLEETIREDRKFVVEQAAYKIAGEEYYKYIRFRRESIQYTLSLYDVKPKNPEAEIKGLLILMEFMRNSENAEHLEIRNDSNEGLGEEDKICTSCGIYPFKSLPESEKELVKKLYSQAISYAKEVLIDIANQRKEILESFIKKANPKK